MRMAPILVGALVATPALASGTRVGASLDVSYTPAARRPVGVGASVEVTRALTQALGNPVGNQGRARVAPRPLAGAGLRFDVFTDRAAQVVLQPIVGTSLIGQRNDCAAFKPALLADLRPGLALRTRGGAASTVGGGVGGAVGVAAFQGRLRSAISLAKAPKQAARSQEGRFQDTTFVVGGGFAGPTAQSCVIVGRPLRDDGVIQLPDADGPPPALLAADWLQQAREEHAAVAAFLRLGAELELVGAPTHLVRACYEAAEDEAKHARLCLQRAADHGGRPFALDEIRTGPRDFGSRFESLRTLAAESWQDGALNEGLAALDALVQAHCASDPLDRAVHALIAVEESRHAALGAQIAAWCEEEMAA